MPPGRVDVESLPPESALLVAMTRLEGKLDTALATLVPTLDAQSKELSDHEARLRALEARQTVTPIGLWTTVVGVVTVAGALLAIAERFTLN